MVEKQNNASLILYLHCDFHNFSMKRQKTVLSKRFALYWVNGHWVNRHSKNKQVLNAFDVITSYLLFSKLSAS